MLFAACTPAFAQTARVEEECKDAPRPYWGDCVSAVRSGKQYDWSKLFSDTGEVIKKIPNNSHQSLPRNDSVIHSAKQNKQELRVDENSENLARIVDHSARQTQSLEQIDFDLKVIAGVGVFWSILGVLAMLTVK